MPRPKKCRLIENFPDVTLFKPSGKMMNEMEFNVLNIEELESLRLADFEAKKHSEAAEVMSVSRATFGRIVERARFTIADALINGKAIIIKGGDFCVKNIDKTSDDFNEIIQLKKNKCKSCRRNKHNKLTDTAIANK